MSDHDISEAKRLICDALDDGEQLKIRFCDRIGHRQPAIATSASIQDQGNESPASASNRPRPLRVISDSPDEAKHLFARAIRVRKLHAASKLGCQEEYTHKERIEWRTRREALKVEMAERRQNGEERKK